MPRHPSDAAGPGRPPPGHQRVCPGLGLVMNGPHARSERVPAGQKTGEGRQAPISNVAIVGSGLVGGSFALACRDAGVARVSIWDQDPGVRQTARERRIADAVPDTIEDTVAGVELVVLAVPATAVPPVCQQLAAICGPGTVLTDVASVKSRLVVEVEDLLPEGLHFIGGHPMAGSERSGVEAADGTLFQGATWVLTPTASSEPAAFERVSGLLRRIGAHVLAVDPESHDAMVAVSSHLPQVLASTLMGLAADLAAQEGDGVLETAAGGFRDATRIAGSDPDLWVGILIENRDAVLEALDRFGERLGALRAALDDGDAVRLRGMLEAGRAGRRRLARREIADEVVDLVVPVDDRPAALAAVTTTLGEAGINIGDLHMRHASDGSRGSLVVAVIGARAAERARSLLAARGFPSHVEGRGDAG